MLVVVAVEQSLMHHPHHTTYKEVSLVTWAQYLCLSFCWHSRIHGSTIRKNTQESIGALPSEIPGQRSSENGSRRNSRSGMASSLQKITEVREGEDNTGKSGLRSFMGFLGMDHGNIEKSLLKPREEDPLIDSDDERPESFDDELRRKEMRRGIDLATTLERIEKNFVITDPRLPDNPIIFASDSFLQLTEYSREEILGRNCRFFQGPGTDRGTVKKIRDAIDNQTEIFTPVATHGHRRTCFFTSPMPFLKNKPFSLLQVFQIRLTEVDIPRPM
ncbi:hypothetical protein ACP70R_033585 [Stipagrostis hirtigluma subsp. patula]